MASFRNAYCPFVFCLLCLALTGCSRSDVAHVAGQLLYKGTPVPNATIHFVPETGRPSMGDTDQNGNFVLTYDPQTKGAKLGKHRVFVQYNSIAAQSSPGTIPGVAVKVPEQFRAFFGKYNGDKSKIEVVIEGTVSDLKLDWD